MTVSIKNGGYAFLIRLDLMFPMSGFLRPVCQTLNYTNLV